MAFSESAFALLAGLEDSGRFAYYKEREPTFKKELVDPFQRIFTRVLAALPEAVPDNMETRRRLFSRFDHQWNKDQAWTFYWGAAYTPPKRTQGVQLFMRIFPQRVDFGFSTNSSGAAMKQYEENWSRLRDSLVDVLAPALRNLELSSGSRDEEPDSDWFDGWERGDNGLPNTLFRPLPREQVLATSEDDLVALGALTLSDLFPLVYLATLSEPMAAIENYLAVRPLGTPATGPAKYFIFNQHPESESPYGDIVGARLGFTSNTTGRGELLKARRGRFIYYRPTKSKVPAAERKVFFGSGRIDDVREAKAPVGEEEFEALLSDYATFSQPVPAQEVPLPGKNTQHSIREISAKQFNEIVARGQGQVTSSEFDFEWLMKETLLGRDRLKDFVDALETRGQVIFAGPPGTGKTWVAEHLIQHLSNGSKDRTKIVQFHPSYGYEEFVEGLKPDWDDDRQVMRFEPVKGVVLRAAAAVEADGLPYYLILDEMNRANLPRVLGELMYLLEYRKLDGKGDQVSFELQYGGYGAKEPKSFRLPRGLRFIGTMNTVDRSIRSIDSALRRRFEIFEFKPDAEVLAAWYETYAPVDRPKNINRVPDLIDGFLKLNAALDKAIDRHHQVGHSFFMKPEMTRERLRQVWERQLFPLLEEYFFDQPDKLEEDFLITNFWTSLSS